MKTMTQHNQELFVAIHFVAIAEPNCFMSSKLKFTKLCRHRLVGGSGDADEFEAEDSSSMADAKLQVGEKSRENHGKTENLYRNRKLSEDVKYFEM